MKHILILNMTLGLLHLTPAPAPNIIDTYVPPTTAPVKQIKQIKVRPIAKLAPIQTPAPAKAEPTPAAPAASGSIQQIIINAANEFGVPPSYLLSVASCESGFNPNASNGSHFGLFQFLPSTYAAYAPLAGAGPDYWNPTNNARTAAYMFAHGQSGQWTCG